MIERLSVRACCMVASVLLGATTLTANGVCADIGFARNGPFEVCLNEAYNAWVRHQAELLVTADPRAKSLDDAAVAAWTAATLDNCRKKAEVDPGSAERFGRYMGRWRDHVFDVADGIRRRSQSD